MRFYFLLLISFAFLVGLFFLAIPQNSYAVAPAIDRATKKLETVGQGTGLSNKLEDDTTIYARTAQIVNIALGLTGIVATIYLIVGGIKWLRAGGNEQNVTEAQGTIRSAIIGLIVVLASYIVVNFLVANIIEAVA